MVLCRHLRRGWPLVAGALALWAAAGPVPARAQDTVEEEAVFDERGEAPAAAAPAAPAPTTIEEEAVFDDEDAAPASAVGPATRAVAGPDAAPDRVPPLPPLAAIAEHDLRTWLLLLPLALLGLLAVPVRWRETEEKKR